MLGPVLVDVGEGLDDVDVVSRAGHVEADAVALVVAVQAGVLLEGVEFFSLECHESSLKTPRMAKSRPLLDEARAIVERIDHDWVGELVGMLPANFTEAPDAAVTRGRWAP